MVVELLTPDGGLVGNDAKHQARRSLARTERECVRPPRGGGHDRPVRVGIGRRCLLQGEGAGRRVEDERTPFRFRIVHLVPVEVPRLRCRASDDGPPGFAHPYLPTVRAGFPSIPDTVAVPVVEHLPLQEDLVADVAEKHVLHVLPPAKGDRVAASRRGRLEPLIGQTVQTLAQRVRTGEQIGELEHAIFGRRAVEPVVVEVHGAGGHSGDAPPLRVGQSDSPVVHPQLACFFEPVPVQVVVRLAPDTRALHIAEQQAVNSLARTEINGEEAGCRGGPDPAGLGR